MSLNEGDYRAHNGFLVCGSGSINHPLRKADNHLFHETLIMLLLRRRHSQFADFLARRSVGKRWLSVDRLVGNFVVSVFAVHKLSMSLSIRPEGHPRLVHTESDYPVNVSLFWKLQAGVI